jgi:hypothetical protein
MPDNQLIQRSPEELQETAGVYAWHRLGEGRSLPPEGAEATRQFFRDLAPQDPEAWFAGQVPEGYLRDDDIRRIYEGFDPWPGMERQRMPTWRTASPAGQVPTSERPPGPVYSGRRLDGEPGAALPEGSLRRGANTLLNATGRGIRDHAWPAVRDVATAWATSPRENDPTSSWHQSGHELSSPAQQAETGWVTAKEATRPVREPIGEYTERLEEADLAHSGGTPAFLEAYYRSLDEGLASDRPPPNPDARLQAHREAIHYPRYRSIVPWNAGTGGRDLRGVNASIPGIIGTVLGTHARTGDRFHARHGHLSGQQQVYDSWLEAVPEVNELYSTAGNTELPAGERARSMRQIEALWKERQEGGGNE